MDELLFDRSAREMVSYLMYEHEVFREKASNTATHLKLQLISADSDMTLKSHTQHFNKYYLHYGALGLSLRCQSSFKQGPIYCDFDSKQIIYRRKYGGGNGQALARAVGVTNECKPKVLDLTAGLGIDSFILATLGCKILMLERNPIVYELLCDGLARASEMTSDTGDLALITERLKLNKIDALDYLAKLAPENKFDVIYLDPMFELPAKVAKAKKEMHALQNLVGADSDAGKVLKKAMRHARYRTVVKRSNKSPSLTNQKPDVILKGKSTRYDIYINRRLPPKLKS
jgi:16S rRNA (guanine1516-N2)-methyltransferase